MSSKVRSAESIIADKFGPAGLIPPARTAFD